jgi:hypothetical protein
MKIEISEESLEFIKNLSKEMLSQDRRCTADPYFYIIRAEEVRVVPDGYGDEVRYLWDNDEMTREELLKLINEDPGVAGTRNNKEVFRAMNDDDKIAATIFYQDGIVTEHTVVTIKYIPENHNVFLTEKACHKHMENNHYHFKKPFSYVNHAWRNPELEQLFKIIHEIAGEKK